jgi:SPP1 family predicted phage head-tail adaptor
MRSGDLDRRITIEGQQVTTSDSGQEIVTWVFVTTVWAELLPIRGGERYAAQQLVGQAITTFSFRWTNTTKTVTTKHRVVYDGREFNIVDVREPKRREEIQIDCVVPSEEPIGGAT